MTDEPVVTWLSYTYSYFPNYFSVVLNTLTCTFLIVLDFTTGGSYSTLSNICIQFFT